jgi:pimeloyl-ACP methyl ester carboxylesterase
VESFTRAGLTFPVTDGGPPGGTPVILLHGFPADRRCWTAVVASLQEAGYRTLAPDQRGYSPTARPPGRSAYRLPELVADVLALADQAGVDRFHVVGHDWGAVVAWVLAGDHGHRVASLAALSVPHPSAMAAAARTSTQALHSWYMAFFNIPALPERVLAAGGGAVMRAALRRTGLSVEVASRYSARAADREAMSGPLNWYRALPLQLRMKVPPSPVPTLFVWSDGDTAITRQAADGCRVHVTGPFRYEVLHGVSHWIPEEAPGAVTTLLLSHLAST